MNLYSTNGRVPGDRNFAFTIRPDAPLGEQIQRQITGVDATTDEIVALHPIAGVGSSTVAFLRGRNNSFPTVALAGPDGVVQGQINLHRFRHEEARAERRAFLETEDDIAASAAIVVNASGRELPAHQRQELMELAGASELVVCDLQLGQVDLGRDNLGEWLLRTLVESLRAAGVGRSIASRRVVAITAGLSPVNAIIVTAIHALAESWCAQPVAVNRDGIFHFEALLRLEDMEALGRTASAFAAPIQVPRELFDRLVLATEGDLRAELEALAS